ncbi:MAG: hypothetical protein Q7K45_01235, partial [Nanoarchaeota archaeon]|nr:hypothetical protein [Nanoarchaeota archaeon]
MAESKTDVQDVGLEIATTFLKKRDYRSLADLVEGNPYFALERGKAVVERMFHQLQIDGKPFDYGHQLTGDQLQVLAYVKKAGAPIDEGNLKVHFEYVARMEPDPDKIEKRYVLTFPDFPKTVPSYAPRSIKLVEAWAKPILVASVENLMEEGKSLPKPKYALRERSRRVKRQEIKLTLADLFTVVSE